MSDSLALARAARKTQTDVAAILAGEDFIGHGLILDSVAEDPLGHMKAAVDAVKASGSARSLVEAAAAVVYLLTATSLLRPQESGTDANASERSGKLAAGDVRSVLQRALTVKTGDDGVLDAVGSATDRARIAAALLPKVAKYRAAGTPLERLRLASEIRALLAQLGGAASGPSLAKLQAIAAGAHDSMGAEDLHYELRAELVDNWGEGYDEALSDDAAAAAHAAINRWMTVEGAEYA